MIKMTEQEMKVLDLSAQLWNEFFKLSGGHDDDVPDFRFHIHALQRIIIARGYVNQDVGMPTIDTGSDNWVLSAFAAANEKMKNPFRP